MSADRNHEHAIGIFSENLTEALAIFIEERRSRGLKPYTLEVYQRDVLRMIEFFKEIDAPQNILSIMPHHIRGFISHLREEGHNEGGVHSYYRAIRAFFSWYWFEFEPESPNPMRKVKLSPPDLNPIPGIKMSHFKKLIDAAQDGEYPKRDRAIFVFLLDTMVRASECLRLNIVDVNFATGAVAIQKTKTGRSRTVYIGRRSKRYLRQYLKERMIREEKQDFRNQDPLFTSETGDRLKFSGLRQIVYRNADRAGIPRVGLHAFRRAGALQMLRRGEDIMHISRLLGHRRVNTTQRYLATDDSDLQDSHRRGSPVDNLDM
jgi:site-specific recombinase XerD